MRFHDLQLALRKNFDDLVARYDTAYQTDVDKDVLWSTYLESFPARVNPIYRTRREFDCSCCRHFIKTIGGIVFIDENLDRHTIWGFTVEDPDFQLVLDAVNTYVLSRSITDEYITKETFAGTEKSHEYDSNTGNLTTWEHFYLPIPDPWQYRGRDTIDTEKAHRRSAAEVFARTLREITMESIDTVLELIGSNTLYKGQEWKNSLLELKKYKTEYDAIPEAKRDLYALKASKKAGPVLSRMRNHSIGTLLVDISENVDLNEAVRRYEAIVAPANYKRPKAIFTEKMLEEAKKTIQDLGYMESLPRRYAQLDDIRVNNILFSNRDAAKRIVGATVFDEMKADAKKSPKKFDRVEEISAETFIKEVLPTAKEIEAYVENRHAPNFVSVIAPQNSDAPSMFKWNNPFSWAYAGNITDSDVKQNVKSAGGRVDGVLRFSIQWNDTGEYSRNDLDAHCIEPSGEEIAYYNKLCRDGGNLDVDITHPNNTVAAVENITWPDLRRMRPGKYRFFVHQYANRGGRDGFRAEIEFDGQIFKYDYRKELRQNEKVEVAFVTLDSKGNFTIEHSLPADTSSTEIWGIKTMDFVPVSVVMFSPNYWDEQTGIGHKHLFFILKDCKNPEEPNGFYNEFLKQELAEHKRVFEALGGKMKVAYVDDQLSGLGFSTTKRGDIVLKVKGATERVMRICF